MSGIQKYLIKRLHQGEFNTPGQKSKSTKAFKKALQTSKVELPDVSFLPNLPALKPHLHDSKPTGCTCGCGGIGKCNHNKPNIVTKSINRKTIVNELRDKFKRIY